MSFGVKRKLANGGHLAVRWVSRTAGAEAVDGSTTPAGQGDPAAEACWGPVRQFSFRMAQG
jgi:hypothetical protein